MVSFCFDFLINSKYRAILLLLNSIRSLFELWWNILPRVWLDFNVRQTNYDVNWYPNLSKHLNFRLFSVDCTCSYKNIHRTYIIRNLWKYKPDLLGTLCRAALENLKFYNKKFGSLAIFRSIINNRAFSLTWLADMRIYWNKRKCLLKKKVYPPQDWLRTPTWSPFHCFGNRYGGRDVTGKRPFMFTTNGKRQHSPRDQVYPPLTVYSSS